MGFFSFFLTSDIMASNTNLSSQKYREIAELIESGEYFLEARNWYLNTYVTRFVERAYLIILVLGLVFLYYMCGVYKSAIEPINKSLPVKVTISSAADFSTRIIYLGNKQKDFDINLVFIKYFAGRFIEAIESYDYRKDFKKLRINKKMLETLASPEILDYYIDKISIRNSDSIRLKYKKDIVRTIIVDKDKIDIAPIEENENEYSSKNKSDDTKEYQVTANFDAIEYNKDGTGIKTKWQAKFILSFQIIEYNFKEKEYSPLNFKVLSYESKIIE